MKRIIIAGSRKFQDYNLLKKEVCNILNLYNATDNIEIVVGGAEGADKLGEKLAKEIGLNYKVFNADWNGLGKNAGFIRNAEMAKYASENDYEGILIAFWNGTSRGTKHMIDLAKENGLEVFINYYDINFKERIKGWK